MAISEKNHQFPPLPLLEDDEVIEQQPDQRSLTERYTEKSIRFIRDNKENPFFLYLGHMHVHLPLYAPEIFERRSRNGAYGACVMAIDWSTGAIVDALKRYGVYENTLIIFTSDNGSRCRGEGGSNGVLRGIKTTTWEGGQRVPCIIRWPGHIPAGSTCTELATAMDFYPTLAGLAGCAMPTDRVIDGRDILPLMLSGGAAKSPHEAFFYYNRNDLEAVRDSRWKLHVRKSRQAIAELYDLRNDPGESRNVYAAEPAVVARLNALLERCREDLGDEAMGLAGRQVRPAGRVTNPRTLTQYRPDHPYMIATYDLQERG